MTETSSDQHVLYSSEAGVATLTLNRPERLNALGDTLREDLHETNADLAEAYIGLQEVGRSIFAPPGMEESCLTELQGAVAQLQTAQVQVERQMAAQAQAEHVPLMA